MRLNLGTSGMSLQHKLLSNSLVEAQNIASATLPLPSRSSYVLTLLGLQHTRPFHRDFVFLLMLFLGPMVWLAMIGVFGVQPLPWHAVWSLAFLSVALWQPLFEELLFRGIVQGHLLHSIGRQEILKGLSLANLLTSLLFTLAHLPSHSVSWSLLVFLPSLCFGFVRDRFGSVYPSIALHAFYNTGYVLLTGSATLLSSR